MSSKMDVDHYQEEEKEDGEDLLAKLDSCNNLLPFGYVREWDQMYGNPNLKGLMDHCMAAILEYFAKPQTLPLKSGVWKDGSLIWRIWIHDFPKEAVQGL